jgi:hypothetical protein
MGREGDMYLQYVSPVFGPHLHLCPLRPLTASSGNTPARRDSPWDLVLALPIRKPQAKIWGLLDIIKALKCNFLGEIEVLGSEKWTNKS